MIMPQYDRQVASPIVAPMPVLGGGRGRCRTAWPARPPRPML